jgi:glycosyltransferase involved in cell wall biosynthesis
LGRHDAVIADHDAACPWRTLPACDVALAMGDAGAGLSMLWAMAAGVPIIAEARYATSEIIEDRHSALLTRPGKTPAIAERLTQLLADRQLAWKIRDAARNEAYSYFSRQRYCQSLTTVYESFAAGNPIEIPPMEPTGGLRFMGRV